MSKQPSLLDPADDLAQVIGPELAKHFLDHRKMLKKPMTQFAASLMAKKLRTFPDPVAAVEQSILKGWQDVFPVENSVVRLGRTSQPQRGVSASRQKLQQELADEQARAQRQEDQDHGHAGRVPLLGWSEHGRPH